MIESLSSGELQILGVCLSITLIEGFGSNILHARGLLFVRKACFGERAKYLGHTYSYYKYFILHLSLVDLYGTRYKLQTSSPLRRPSSFGVGRGADIHTSKKFRCLEILAKKRPWPKKGRSAIHEEAPAKTSVCDLCFNKSNSKARVIQWIAAASSHSRVKVKQSRYRPGVAQRVPGS